MIAPPRVLVCYEKKIKHRKTLEKQEGVYVGIFIVKLCIFWAMVLWSVPCMGHECNCEQPSVSSEDEKLPWRRPTTRQSSLLHYRRHNMPRLMPKRYQKDADITAKYELSCVPQHI